MNWITWAELAAAVSNAGGLGVIGPNSGERTPTPDAVETGERLRRQIRKARTLTKKPFGVNLVLALTDYPPGGKAFSDQCFKVILEEKPPVVVLVGGTPSIYTRELKAAGIKVLHRALPVNIDAAKRSEQEGVDGIIAVGHDGGGHVGHDAIPTFVLIPGIVSAVRVPVVAGGGIMDGRGMAAALALGADAVYMGTRFIITKECQAHQSFKEAIIKATDTSTGTCVGAIGILRALKNPLLEKCIQMEKSGAEPIARSKTYAPGFRTGMLEGDLINGTLGCGAGAGLVREIKSAGEVVSDVMSEAGRIIADLRAGA